MRALLVVTVLLLAGCTSAPAAPTADSVRTPADACNTPSLDGMGLWLEADGDRFEAGVVGEGSTAVVLVHQSGANYCGWLPFVDVLSEHGIQSILLNLCGSGLSECASEEHIVDTGANAVVAATEWARANGADRVVVMGASLGGAVVIAAAGSEHGTGIEGVVDLSGPISFDGTSTTDSAPGITAPMLLAVSQSDSVVSVDELEALGALTKSQSVAVYPDGAGHGWDMLFEGSGEPSALNQLVLEFIEG